MLNLFLATIVSGLIVGNSAFAAEICNSLAECRQLRDKVAARIISLQQVPQFGDIVKKDAVSENYCFKVDGKGLCLMKQAQAKDYCISLRMHLPTARELAQLSTSRGAKGILKVEEYEQKKAAGENLDDYFLIGSLDGSTFDKFYFSSSGYQRPVSDLTHDWILSSSNGKFNSRGTYLFDGNFGRIELVFSNYNFGAAVRCVYNP